MQASAEVDDGALREAGDHEATSGILLAEVGAGHGLARPVPAGALESRLRQLLGEGAMLHRPHELPAVLLHRPDGVDPLERVDLDRVLVVDDAEQVVRGRAPVAALQLATGPEVVHAALRELPAGGGLGDALLSIDLADAGQQRGDGVPRGNDTLVPHRVDHEVNGLGQNSLDLIPDIPKPVYG